MIRYNTVVLWILMLHRCHNPRTRTCIFQIFLNIFHNSLFLVNKLFPPNLKQNYKKCPTFFHSLYPFPAYILYMILYLVLIYFFLQKLDISVILISILQLKLLQINRKPYYIIPRNDILYSLNKFLMR